MLPLSLILYINFLKFLENWDKGFQLGPMPFFNLVKFGTVSPAAHFLNCVNIGRSQIIEAITRGLQDFFWKTFPKVNRRFLRSWLKSSLANRDVLKSKYVAYLCLYFSRITLKFSRLELRGCLYERRDGINNQIGQFLSCFRI